MIKGTKDVILSDPRYIYRMLCPIHNCTSIYTLSDKEWMRYFYSIKVTCGFLGKKTLEEIE